MTQRSGSAALFAPGLVSVTFRHLGIEDVVSLASEARLASITWGGDVHVAPGDHAAAARAHKLSQDAGLAIHAYGSYWRSGPEDFEPVLTTARQLGASRIRVWAGTVGSSIADDTQRRTVAERVAAAADRAAAHGIGLDLEFHPDTLTDTAGSTRHLLDEIDAQRRTATLPVLTSWQPRPGISSSAGSGEIEALSSRISTFHVFAWDGEATRLPLVDHCDLWLAWLSVFERCRPRGASGTVPLQLEFVRDDSVEAFRADARESARWMEALRGGRGRSAAVSGATGTVN